MGDPAVSGEVFLMEKCDRLCNNTTLKLPLKPAELLETPQSLAQSPAQYENIFEALHSTDENMH